MSMTSRKRVEAALRRQPVDRTPYFEYCLLSPLADRFLGHPFALTPETWASLEERKGFEAAVHQRAHDHLDLAQKLGHDMMYIVPTPAPKGAAVYGYRETEIGPDDDPVEVVERRNAAMADAPPILPDDCYMIYPVLRDAMERRGMDLPILAPAYAHGVWTDVALMQTMLIEPDVAHAHFALATRRSLATADKYMALGVDQIGVGGDFSGTRPLISPESYRTFIVPEMRKVTDHIHARGKFAVNASDGNLWPVIEDFLFGCGVDAYLEIDFHAGMDLAKLQDAYGGRITFYGNLDCGNILSFSTPDQVREHVRACLAAGRKHGGHILCASNAITASVPMENYLAAINAYREDVDLPHLSA